MESRAYDYFRLVMGQWHHEGQVDAYSRRRAMRILRADDIRHEHPHSLRKPNGDRYKVAAGEFHGRFKVRLAS
jgi:hypothetical protein